MRKIKLYIAQSIDGFIATPSGSVEWLNSESDTEVDENAYGYSDFYKSIDTTLMGYNTYKEILNFGIPFPYSDKKNFVFSRSHKELDENPVEFITENVVEFISDLKNLKGKDIWLVGGSEINKLLLNKNLIDEIIITIKSTILGKGIPLFANGTDLKNFNFSSAKMFDNNFVEIIMSRK